MYEKIVQGAIAGLAYALVGYGKKTKMPDFKWPRVASSLVLGAVAGAIAGFSGTEIGVTYTMLLSAGFAGMAENFIKLIYRRIIKR